MSAIKPQWIVWGLAAGVALIVLNRLASGQLVSKSAAAVTQVPFDAFKGAAEGIFGLPDPAAPASQTECDKALAAGDDWKASFYCPAAKWFKGLFDGK